MTVAAAPCCRCLQALIDPAAVAKAEVPGVDAAIGANAVRPIVDATAVGTTGLRCNRELPGPCTMQPTRLLALSCPYEGLLYNIASCPGLHCKLNAVFQQQQCPISRCAESAAQQPRPNSVSSAAEQAVQQPQSDGQGSKATGLPEGKPLDAAVLQGVTLDAKRPNLHLRGALPISCCVAAACQRMIALSCGSHKS